MSGTVVLALALVGCVSGFQDAFSFDFIRHDAEHLQRQPTQALEGQGDDVEDMRHPLAALQDEGADLMRRHKPQYRGSSTQQRHELQVDAGKPSQKTQKVLPSVSTVLEQPTNIFKSMNSHLSKFEDMLAQTESSSAAQLAAKKEGYDKKLHAKVTENRALEAANAELEAEIADVRHRTAELRKEAAKLTERSGKLTQDLNAASRNLTIAQEFAQKTLSSAADQLENSSELAVLDELDAQDAAEAKARARTDLLRSVGDVAFMQLGEEIEKPRGADHPQDVLQSLITSLAELVEQQNASEAALEAAFEKESADADELHNSLLETQATLNATLESETELHQRLTAAVKYLNQTVHELEERTKSLGAYAVRLGSAESFVSLLQVETSHYHVTAQTISGNRENHGAQILAQSGIGNSDTPDAKVQSASEKPQGWPKVQAIMDSVLGKRTNWTAQADMKGAAGNQSNQKAQANAQMVSWMQKNYSAQSNVQGASGKHGGQKAQIDMRSVSTDTGGQMAQLPADARPGCWFLAPQGCPGLLVTANTWVRDGDTGTDVHTNSKACKHRKGRYNYWCGIKDAQMHFVHAPKGAQFIQAEEVVEQDNPLTQRIRDRILQLRLEEGEHAFVEQEEEDEQEEEEG